MRLRSAFMSVVLSGWAISGLAGCVRYVSTGTGGAPLTLQADPPMPDLAGLPRQELESGLIIVRLQEGSGPPPEPGQTVRVHYNAWLASGRMFDSSRQRGVPFDYPFATGMVVPGFDEGVRGMLPGERRVLIIPPHLGYGANGAPPVIPPDATLVFEIEYLGTAGSP